MAISNTAVLASDTTIYTSSGSSAITVIYLCNTNVAARTIDIHLIPSGGSVGVATQIYDALVIQPDDTYIIDMEKVVLDNGDFISVVADATGVTATVSSVGL